MNNRLSIKLGVSIFYTVVIQLFLLSALCMLVLMELYWLFFTFLFINYAIITYNRILYLEDSYFKSLTLFGVKKISYSDVQEIVYVGFFNGPPGTVKIILKNGKKFTFETDYKEYMVRVLNFLNERTTLTNKTLRGFPIGLIDYENGIFKLIK